MTNMRKGTELEMCVVYICSPINTSVWLVLSLDRKAEGEKTQIEAEL